MESVDLDRGSELAVDLETLTVTTPAGKVLPFEFDESTRYRLLNGLDDIGLTLQHADEITAYEDAARSTRMTHVAVLPGDGIGPEVAAEAIRVLDALGIGHSEHAFGGNAILAQGDPLPAETLAACREADAVLLAAVGLPELEGQAVRPEQGLLGAPQGARRLREPAAGPRARDRHDDRARARRRALLRRQGHARRRHLVRHVRVLAARGGADRPARLRDRGGARRPPDLGRQGERHAHLAAVARRRLGARREQLSRRRSSITRSSTRSR